jgi:transcriptional regulator with XRE-family HTH domain
MPKTQNPKRHFDAALFFRMRRQYDLSYLECGRQVGVTDDAIKNIEQSIKTPSLPTFRGILKAFSLGMVETFQLLRLTPPGVTHSEFQKFIAACRQEQLPPTKVLADFIRTYAEA